MQNSYLDMCGNYAMWWLNPYSVGSVDVFGNSEECLTAVEQEMFCVFGQKRFVMILLHNRFDVIFYRHQICGYKRWLYLYLLKIHSMPSNPCRFFSIVWIGFCKAPFTCIVLYLYRYATCECGLKFKLESYRYIGHSCQRGSPGKKH